MLQLLQVDLRQRFRQPPHRVEQLAVLVQVANQLRPLRYSHLVPVRRFQPHRKRSPSELRLGRVLWKLSWLLLAFHQVLQGVCLAVPPPAQILQCLPTVLPPFLQSHHSHSQLQLDLPRPHLQQLELPRQRLRRSDLQDRLRWVLPPRQ